MIMEQQAGIVIIMIMEQQAGHPWRHISEVDICQRESTRPILDWQNDNDDHVFLITLEFEEDFGHKILVRWTKNSFFKL